MNLITTINKVFNQGGLLMWIIFVSQAISFMIMTERFYTLYIKRKLHNKKIAQNIFEKDIKKGNIVTALNKAKTLTESPVFGSVIEAGVKASINKEGTEDIQSKMDKILLSEKAFLEKRNKFLIATGNIGSISGIIGTIIGLTHSFNALSIINPIEKAQLLSQGLSMALYSTAYSFLMAVPALIMYTIYQNRTNLLQEDLNQSSLMIYNWLVRG